ncbi:MAG TPA: ribulose-phosphate 3-epimerase [Longimicrobiales bacterium]|nr:ribulose-phosphate 3-epimerase [Longimicrobiales bacterium]
MKIAPSILSCDFGRLAEEIRAAEDGGADWIHVDVMDGHFVPNLTLGPVIVAAARRATALPLDVHLMIESPDRYLAAFVDAGADIVTVHQEVCPHLHRTLQRTRELGARAGVALNPATPVESVRDVVEGLDLLLVMSVNPGFGGQSFIPSSLAKLGRARALLAAAGSSAELEVDGGVGPDNAAEIVSAGASVLVAGSAVYGPAGGPAASIAAIRSGRGA